jgi:hypothetical protein
VAPKASILDEKLANLFAQAVGGAVDSLRDLRESVCMYVDAERARGASLDEVIARVSTMLERVRDSGSARAPLTPEAAAAERELAREMVQWCIDSYLPARARKKS